jgi:ClpP class serine protease
VVSTTSLAGSIGVVKSIHDYTKAYEKMGITEIEIVSSQSPFKRYDPASKDGRTAMASSDGTLPLGVE